MKGLKSCLCASLIGLLTVSSPTQEPLLPAGDSELTKGELHELEKVSTIVRGQCVDGETGEPLAGCRVDISVHVGRADIGDKGWLARPGPVFTDDGGRFAVRILANEDFQGGLNISLDGRWPRTGLWRYFVPGVTEELGQIKLYEGVHARGLVVNTEGQAMAGVRLRINSLPLYIGMESDREEGRLFMGRVRVNDEPVIREMHYHANKTRYATTGEDGRFQTDESLPAGTFDLSVRVPGLELVEPKQITIPEDGPMQALRITLRENTSIQGLVVDEVGEPVKGVYLSAELLRSGRSASAYSRADGSFQIYREHDSPEKVRIEITDPGPCEPREPTGAVPWGTENLEIVLRRALTIPLHVVEAGTGEPVEQYSIRCYPINRRRSSSGDRNLRFSGEHEDGNLSVDRVRRGPNRLVVIPRDAQLLPMTLDFNATELMPRLQVKVERLVPMMVRVLDRNGQPLGNAQVRVILPGNFRGHDGNERVIVNDPRSKNQKGWSTDVSVTFDTVIYTARTDGGGLCVVYGVDGREDHVLGMRKLDNQDVRIESVSFGKGHREREVVLDEK